MTEWHFYDKVYRVWVVLLIAEFDEFTDFMGRTGYLEVKELHKIGTTAMCVSLTPENNDMDNTAYIVWFKKWEIPCLVHELSHLVMMVFDDKGVELSRDNTEAFAYYQEFWVNEMTKTRRRLPAGRAHHLVKK